MRESTAAWFLSRLVTNMLYGIDPGDPATFAAVASAFLAIAWGAAWLPARGAARVDVLGTLQD